MQLLRYLEGLSKVKARVWFCCELVTEDAVTYVQGHFEKNRTRTPVDFLVQYVRVVSDSVRNCGERVIETPASNVRGDNERSHLVKMTRQ